MANRYWVGGNANWDHIAGLKWATTSGGAGGASVPTSADDVFFDAASGVVFVNLSGGSKTQKSLNCTGFAGGLFGNADLNFYGDLTLVAGMSYSVLGVLRFFASGTLTSAGKLASRPIEVSAPGGTLTLNDALNIGASSFTLYEGTLNLANFTLTCGTFQSSNSNTRAINFGSGSVVLIGLGGLLLDINNATNFTCAGTGSFARSGSGSSAITLAFGITGGTATNAPNLTLSVSSPIAFTTGSYFKNVNCTGSTSTISGTYNACGSLTLAAVGSYASLAPTFRASGVITSNGNTLGNTTIDGSGITVSLADAIALGSGNTLTLIRGTFDASNFNVTCGFFNSDNSNTRTLNMGSGVWAIWASWLTGVTVGLTFNPGTSTISFVGFGGKTFFGGGLTYYNINQATNTELIISGSNTFNNITNTFQPTTIRFAAGTTQTVSNFGLSGTFANLVTIESSITGSQFNLSKSSGAVNVQCLRIKDSNATGGATWNAVASQDLGNNAGWLFSGGNTFLTFM
jgi:hypothetical protein